MPKGGGRCGERESSRPSPHFKILYIYDIHAFNLYVWSTYYIPGTVLGIYLHEPYFGKKKKMPLLKKKKKHGKFKKF